MMEDNLSQAQKDFLTGFFNRELLSPTLERKVMEAKLHNQKFSILLIDIDHFKKINDKYGHLWGDEFLKYVASTLRLTLSDKGVIFRYGGDEFVVVFKEADPKKVLVLAKMFNLVMRNRPFLFNGHLFKITLSCGMATYPDDAKDAEGLVKIADKAMYISKRSGRNMTVRANRIGIQRLKKLGTLLTQIIVVLAVWCVIGGYFFKDKIKAYLPDFSKISLKRIIPARFNADTKIVLQSGEVVVGRAVAEDDKTIVVEISMGQGTGQVPIEKRKILSIERKGAGNLQ